VDEGELYFRNQIGMGTTLSSDNQEDTESYGFGKSKQVSVWQMVNEL
jgi:hypothetical protein